MANENSRGINTKITALEANYKTLHEDVTKLGSSIEHIANETREGFKEVHERLTRANKTDWGILFAGASVLLIIVGMTSSVFLGYLNRLDENQKEISKIIHAHQEDGHPQVIKELVLENKKDINALSFHTESDLEKMYERIDKEIGLRNAVQDSKINNMVKAVDRLINLHHKRSLADAH